MIGKDRGAAPTPRAGRGGAGRLGRRAAVLVAAGGLGSALAACGRKGDLVPPPEPAAAGEGQDRGQAEGAGG